jgi:hypothetical protein
LAALKPTKEHNMRTTITRHIAIVAALLGALALVPAGAAAKTWFGSSLNHEPANAGSPCDPSIFTPLMCTHVGSFYPGTSGRAMSPTNGKIVRIRVRAQGPMTMKLKLVKVRNLSADARHGEAKVVKVGPVLHVNGPSTDQLNNGIYPVESFRVHLKVRKGQELAIDTTKNMAQYCSNGTPGALTFYNPFLKRGQGFRPSQGTDDCLLLVQAVVRR